MQSLTELYRMGRGPSSSHTMGPEKACLLFRKKNHTSDRFRVVLFGSLAKTGVGHGTDRIVRETMEPMSCEVEFNYEDIPLPHPNTMELYAYRDGQEVDHLRVMSVGGGEICFEGTPLSVPPDVYDIASFEHIAAYCREHGLRLWEYARQVEGETLWAHLYTIWDAMKASIRIGLNTTGTLPGGLDVQRKAKQLMDRQHIDESAETRENRMVCAFAFAVSEQNAAGERIVTAPTCGSADGYN